MFIGFDYGTANCSVAVMRDGKPQLLKMENDSTLLPSMLCAPTREAVSEWLYRHHDVPADDDETQALLRRAIRYNREEDIDVTAKSVQFGLSSLAQYIDDPEEVWFVKSPKSFLGASGLNLPAPEPVFLPPDVTVPSTAWSVLEHEGGIAATLSRRQSTPIPADVVWRPLSPLPLVCLQALPLRSA